MLYWKVDFSCGQSGPSSYTTAPSDHGERRKQTVLGLQRPINVRKGEQILGYINLVPDWGRYRCRVTGQVCLSFVGAICHSKESRQLRIPS